MVHGAVGGVSVIVWRAVAVVAAVVMAGCATEGAPRQPADSAAPAQPSGSGGQSPLPDAPPTLSGGTSPSPATSGPVQDWGLFPFVGAAGSAGTAGTGGANSGGSASGGAAGTPTDVKATCDVLCDCIVDICGNALRIFEHGVCRPGCSSLNDAQLTCRLQECLQGGSDATAASRCEHAVGQGDALPTACQ